MDVKDQKKLPKVSLKIRKKPLANIVSMVLERYVGYYLIDENGKEMTINEAFWDLNRKD